MAHLIRINYPLRSFSLIIAFLTQTLQISKIHRTVSEDSFFEKMELKNRLFQYGKYRLAYLLQEVL